ncbi:MAG: cupin domain-containing protein [Phenylobacterium sp.]|nr:cupin domain-containing protein [Phenylobacterium sp.]
MTAESAAAVIARLDLAPHPEGGWYRETWRAPSESGVRSPGTAILFLLEAGQSSHWHRIDAAELWLFQAGTALTLKTAAHDTGPILETRLGPRASDTPQQVVAPGEWQAAQASPDGWALVACVVVPGFEFAGFELAAPGWAPAAG